MKHDKILLLCIVVLGSTSVGCIGLDRYSMHSADQSGSSYYRLDKLNGGIDLISGASMTKVLSTSRDAELDVVRDLGERLVPGQHIRVHLKTKWRDGYVRYKVRMTPPDSAALLQILGVSALDKDGFSLGDIDVDLASLIVVSALSEDGREIGKEVESASPMDRETYRAMTGWSLSGRLWDWVSTPTGP